MRRAIEDRFDDPTFRLGLVTLVVLLAQAAVATDVLQAELDWVSQFAPLLVHALFIGSRWRSPRAELAFGAAIVLVSLLVLGLAFRLR
ncbi:MAG: hypothetical protein U0446_02815 [Dehalococcoidia bacterium]